jgi:predicted dehydrogenase
LDDVVSTLQQFWRTAARELPIVIIGAGRWGRTWVSVIAAARGSAHGITITARTHPDDVRAWAAARTDLAGLSIVSGLSEAMTRDPQPVAAIVASRPRDHVEDGLAAVAHRLHVLVEKPISVEVDKGYALLAAAHAAKRVLAVGTEFAYLPALHQLTATFAIRDLKSVALSLIWRDAANETRHGALKVRHEETGLLHDLLPHAISIFQAFAGGQKLHVVKAAESVQRTVGQLRLADDAGVTYDFLCDTATEARERRLFIKSDGGEAVLDFTDNAPSLLLNGQHFPLDARLAAMASTLRLELGAFFAVAAGEIDATFITTAAPDLLRLQSELQSVIQIGND